MTICPKCGGIADFQETYVYEDQSAYQEDLYICADCSHEFLVEMPGWDYDLDDYDESDWMCPACGASLTPSGFCPCCDPDAPLPLDYDENTSPPSSDFGEIPF